MSRVAKSAGTSWTPVTESLPAKGRKVLAFYTNSRGNGRTIRAEWVSPKTSESGDDSDIGEYDEDTDCYYDPEGWYECMDNWDDYRLITVHEGEVSHWMPMPAPPEVRP